jgi:long-subunit fatty acid transport protein
MGGKLLDKNFNSQNYLTENDRMKTNINDVSTLKIGGEYKLNANFSLRAGFAYMGEANNPNATKIMFISTVRTDPEFFINNSTRYYTAGFGYRESNWYIDLAYVNKNLNETFYPYDSSYLADGYKAKPANVITTSNNLVFTVGLKF